MSCKLFNKAFFSINLKLDFNPLFFANAYTPTHPNKNNSQLAQHFKKS